MKLVHTFLVYRRSGSNPTLKPAPRVGRQDVAGNQFRRYRRDVVDSGLDLPTFCGNQAPTEADQFRDVLNVSGAEVLRVDRLDLPQQQGWLSPPLPNDIQVSVCIYGPHDHAARSSSEVQNHGDTFAVGLLPLFLTLEMMLRPERSDDGEHRRD